MSGTLNRDSTGIARELWAVTAVAFVARVVTLYMLPYQGMPDTYTYLQAGVDLFGTGRIANDYVMPLYPLWTYVWGGGGWLQLADVALSTATVPLIGLLSFAIFQNRTAAVLAALASAIYPHFLFFSALTLTETPYLLLLTAAFLLLYRRHWLGGSVVLVVSLLVRPAGDLIAPLLVLAFALWVHREPPRIAARRVGLYALVYVVLMTPWWIHNHAKYGEFVRLTLSDGIVLYAGNNPLNESGGGLAIGVDGAGDVDYAEFMEIDDPIERNAAMRAAAMEYILEDPSRFIAMMGVKFQRFWRLWPYAHEYRSWQFIAISLASYGLVLFCAIAFLVTAGRAAATRISPILLFAAYLTLVHMVTIASIRYRLPLDGFLIILATAWIARFVRFPVIPKEP